MASETLRRMFTPRLEAGADTPPRRVRSNEVFINVDTNIQEFSEESCRAVSEAMDGHTHRILTATEVRQARRERLRENIERTNEVLNRANREALVADSRGWEIEFDAHAQLYYLVSPAGEAVFSSADEQTLYTEYQRRTREEMAMTTHRPPVSRLAAERVDRSELARLAEAAAEEATRESASAERERRKKVAHREKAAQLAEERKRRKVEREEWLRQPVGRVINRSVDLG